MTVDIEKTRAETRSQLDQIANLQAQIAKITIENINLRKRCAEFEALSDEANSIISRLASLSPTAVVTDVEFVEFAIFEAEAKKRLNLERGWQAEVARRANLASSQISYWRVKGHVPIKLYNEVRKMH